MPDSSKSLKPSAQAEYDLVSAILDGRFPAGSKLPGERELATQFGVTRPTLREALGRLHRDGWIHIQHGKPTEVRDFREEGGLGVLNGLIQTGKIQHYKYVENLLQVRRAMAPFYTRAAVMKHPEKVSEICADGLRLEDSTKAYMEYDWRLHHALTQISENTIFTMILNGFNGLYFSVAEPYFQVDVARQVSRHWYLSLRQAALSHKPDEAEKVTIDVMDHSLHIFKQVQGVVT
jgi:GntR family negative regulator for fad regulon and positive regulator of fabA